jgi:DNA topoisomerase IA
MQLSREALKTEAFYVLASNFTIRRGYFFPSLHRFVSLPTAKSISIQYPKVHPKVLHEEMKKQMEKEVEAERERRYHALMDDKIKKLEDRLKLFSSEDSAFRDGINRAHEKMNQKEKE